MIYDFQPTMTSKVVKVEEIHGLPGERAKTNQTFSTDLLACGTESSVIPTSRLGSYETLFQ